MFPPIFKIIISQIITRHSFDDKLIIETMKKILTGAHLKWIALITMLIDHIGAVLIIEQLININVNPNNSSLANPWVLSYWVTRLIGRLAFPIFSFLLVEGFIHTKNRLKYGTTLFIFFLLSEVPFDLATKQQVLEFSYQNIFLTLFLGFALMQTIEKTKTINPLLPYLWLMLFGFTNHLLAGDYQCYGIGLIFLLYQFRDDRMIRNLSLLIMGLYQMTASLSLIPINLYNGKRGKQPKYFFYLFYPLHLLCLAYLATLI